MLTNDFGFDFGECQITQEENELDIFLHAVAHLEECIYWMSHEPQLFPESYPLAERVLEIMGAGEVEDE